jgi:hypothetical protein
MKRQLLTGLLLLFTAVASWAQNAVAVYQNDGTVATFAFTEKPVVTYSGNDLVLTTTKTSVQFPIYKLKKIDFDISLDDATGVKDVEKEADVQFSFAGGKLIVRGGEAGSQVTIYNIKGVQVGQYQLDSNGNATISTDNLGKDFYVVKSKSFTFKFRKS